LPRIRLVQNALGFIQNIIFIRRAVMIIVHQDNVA